MFSLAFNLMFLCSPAMVPTSELQGEWVGGLKRFSSSTLSMTLECEDAVDGFRATLFVPGRGEFALEIKARDGSTLTLEGEGVSLRGKLEDGQWKGRSTHGGGLEGSFFFVQVDHPDALNACERARREGFLGSLATHRVARLYAARGDDENAENWLLQSVDLGAPPHVIFSGSELDPVRQGARFREHFQTPTSPYPELSQASQTVRLERDVVMPMRDGVELVADIVFPSGPGPFPTILVRTPYGRSSEVYRFGHYGTRGYVLVAQAVRGREESGGKFIPWLNEREDGFDTIDWISRQPWSSGKVGMIGGSYLGQVQWAAAAEAHPALTCIVPQVSGTDHFFENPYDHGIFLMGLIGWADNMRDEFSPPGRITRRDPSALKALPLEDVDDAYLGYDSDIWNRWIELDSPKAWDRSNFMRDQDRIDIPVFHISGWWDGEAIATHLNYAGMMSHDKLDQWLIFGPWPHGFNQSTRFADVEYGPTALLDLEPLWVRWFDTWLKEKDVDLDTVAPVQAFLTGLNQWQEFDTWPPEAATPRRFYLSSSTPLQGGGTRGSLLDRTVPSEHADGYTYDPARVSQSNQPSTGRTTRVSFSAKDEDVLVYQSEPFAESTTLVGPARLDLYFSTSARDTDFFLWPVDIDEGGQIRVLNNPGKKRMRFLSGWDTPQPLEPGEIYRAQIDTFPFFHQFEAGHRLGLILRSEWFPNFDRNLGTGNRVKGDTEMIVAEQKIYHGTEHPSVLEVLELSPSED